MSDEDKLQKELTTSLTKLHNSLVSELKATRSTLTTARSRADAEPWLRELTEKVALSLGALESESAHLSSRLGTNLCQGTVEEFKSRLEPMLKAHRNGLYKSLKRVLQD